MAEATFRVGKLKPSDLTMTLKVDLRELRVRLAIGLWLMKLGARVIGMGVQVSALDPSVDIEISDGPKVRP